MACHLGLAARDLVETSAVIGSMSMLQLASEAGLASAFRAPLEISSDGAPSSMPRPLPNSRSGSYSLVASAPSVPISANAVTPRLPGALSCLGKPWSVRARHTVIVSHRTAISGGLGATRRRCRRLVELSPVFPAHLAARRIEATIQVLSSHSVICCLVEAGTSRC